MFAHVQEGAEVGKTWYMSIVNKNRVCVVSSVKW